MKMNQITTVILAAAGICSVSLVSAENYGRGLSLNPGGGYYSFDSEHNIDDDSFPSVGIEYRFTDALALELTYIDGETVEERNDLATFHVQHLRLDGNYYFNPDRKLQPYLSAGLGMFELTHVEKNILKEDTVADAGVGVRYFSINIFHLEVI